MARADECIYEIIMMGTMWVPLAGLTIQTVATSFETANSTYGPFLLNRYALTWIVEGGGTTQLGDALHETRAGTVLCMTPGVELRHNWGARRSFQSFIVFDPGRVPRSWPAASDWIRQRELSGSETFFDLWRSVVGGYHAGHGEGGLLERSVELLLRMFLTGNVGGDVRLGAELPRPIERALDFLVQRAKTRDPRPRLDEVARAARLSTPHLCRLFRREFDATPLECAEMLRVERAAGLLERTYGTLAEIAEQLAYSSAFHFSRNFKRTYGMPPSEYRVAFRSGLATRPGGIVFRHHRLRSYLYERGPGRVLVAPTAKSARTSTAKLSGDLRRRR